MRQIKISTEYITLGQFLKFSGVVVNGGEVKSFLNNNDVLVDNMPEKRRGKKLFGGEMIKINNISYVLVSANEN